MKRILFGTFLALSLCSMIAACNTTKGAGQDMKAAGNSIEKSADKNGAQP